jgi:hypothetical protein
MSGMRQGQARVVLGFVRAFFDHIPPLRGTPHKKSGLIIV